MIVSSIHTVRHPQIDGRSYVTEVHTDEQGVEYTCEYLADIGTDYVAVRTNRVALLEEQLAEQEFNNLIND